MFLNPSLNSNCSNSLDMRNKLKRHFVTKDGSGLSLFSSDLKNLANSQPNRTFFLRVGQNNFGSKVQFALKYKSPNKSESLQSECLWERYE